jgi:hypothetical protein
MPTTTLNPNATTSNATTPKPKHKATTKAPTTTIHLSTTNNFSLPCEPTEDPRMALIDQTKLRHGLDYPQAFFVDLSELFPGNLSQVTGGEYNESAAVAGIVINKPDKVRFLR